METVLKAIADWIKGILTAGIMSNPCQYEDIEIGLLYFFGIVSGELIPFKIKW